MASSHEYGTLPATVQKDAVSPFKVNFSDADLDRLKQLLKLAPVAPPCYENSLPDGSRKLGIRHEWLTKMKKRWEDVFDWRDQESRINSFPNFKATVPYDRTDPSNKNTIQIHFTALFSRAPKATPVILLHGWPGSFMEFLPMLSILCSKYTPDTLPYHIIVPSLPGYTLSDAPPLDRNFKLEDVARIMDMLMVDILGLTGNDQSGSYVAQGGDVGSRVARILGSQYPRCSGALLNLERVADAPPDHPVSSLTEDEQKALKRYDWFIKNAAAYAFEQGTRPATLGFALTASPLATLAWVGEKFLDWTDPASFVAMREQDHSGSEKLMDEILAHATLYYLTVHVHTPWFSYRQGFDPSAPPPTFYRIEAPKRFGFSYFPMEILLPPKAWVAKTGNLVFWRKHDVGGHFAAMEQPELLLKDLEEFVQEGLQ